MYSEVQKIYKLPVYDEYDETGTYVINLEKVSMAVMSDGGVTACVFPIRHETPRHVIFPIFV